MPTAELSLSELYSQLDKAILAIKSKKGILDAAQMQMEKYMEELRKANDDYVAAIKYANELKGHLASTVDKNIPSLPQEKIR